MKTQEHTELGESHNWALYPVLCLPDLSEKALELEAPGLSFYSLYPPTSGLLDGPHIPNHSSVCPCGPGLTQEALYPGFTQQAFLDHPIVPSIYPHGSLHHLNYICIHLYLLTGV